MKYTLEKIEQKKIRISGIWVKSLIISRTGYVYHHLIVCCSLECRCGAYLWANESDDTTVEHQKKKVEKTKHVFL